MASDVVKRLICICRYLQDPCHVAKFQQLCGVRGTFTKKTAETVESEAKRSVNGARAGQRQRDCAAGGDNAQVHPSQRLGKSLNAGNVKQDDFSGDLLNGPMTSGSDRTEGQHGGSEVAGASEKGSRDRVKPLRRNSLTGDVGQEFIIENKFLFCLFTIGTELGNEMFFIVFFPFLMWNVDPYVSRQLIVVWAWVLFLGQSTKDLVRWTRPASPPVVKVEVFYNTEYSMPSTHAMTGTAMPFCLFMITCSRWEYPFMFGLSVALCWSLLVCTSRIYMGMHSVLEVITGFLYSILILAVIQPMLDDIDTFYLTHSYAPLVVLLVHVGFSLVAFSLDSWSTSRGDTAQALATAAGSALASRLAHQLGLHPDPPEEALPLTLPLLDGALLGCSIMRLLVGVSVLLAVRAAMKVAAVPLACKLFNIPSGDVRKARQHAQVELSYRFIVYGPVAYSCVFLVPLLFDFLGLS
ncbi:sphingosine-1-phosphate phosphatase 1-like [Xyrauchen texanus]|uniref:sphingosine-1-phosphate phosphatase 1-like n=1 Tax=Xyrauchen texanus TaxID=154827 RepID=UPI002241FF53|nr:sphingosine-1-phosphate phosphatase 1-like [Xyrauchen texanus]